jgi:hypothetical protein
MHHFVNNRPVDLPLSYKQLFYDLYANFKVKYQTVLPCVFLHLETTDFAGMDVHLYNLDERTVSFIDDSAIVN